jgi:hypothetical protein
LGPRDQLTDAGCRERREERVTAHARKGDSGDTQGCDRGDAIGSGDREAERPHRAQRGTDDRGVLDPQGIEQGRELRDRVLAQRSPTVVVRVAEPEAGQIEADQPVAVEVRHERRPGRRRHAAAVDEDERRPAPDSSTRTRSGGSASSTHRLATSTPHAPNSRCSAASKLCATRSG